MIVATDGPDPFDDIVADLFKGDLSRFIETTYVPVDETDYAIIRMRLIPAQIDAELRAAMRGAP